MSEYDRLAEMQLRQDTIPKDTLDILEINNDLALQDHPTAVSVVVSPTKRKRNESAPVGTSPNKRAKSSQLRNAPMRPATTSPKSAPKKLKRPRKDPQRHMTNIYPAVKPKGDIWDPEDDNLEENQANTAKNGRVLRSKGTMSQGRQNASAVHGSRSVSRGAPAAKKSKGRPKKKETRTKPGKKTANTTIGSAPQSSDTVQVVPSTIPPVAETTDRGTKKGSTSKLSQREADEHEDHCSEQADLDSSREASPGQEEYSEDSESQEPVENVESGLDGEDKAAEKHMDLLGQETEWKKVVECARSVDKTRFGTTTIRALVSDIKKTKSLYKTLTSLGALDPTTTDESIKQLAQHLDDVEDRIKDIAEENEPNKRPEMVRDIYSRAIPAMVLLLESALSLRTSEGRGLHAYAAMKEIIRLQDMVIMLCKKAIAWKIKPNTGLPILKPTQKVIHPYVRDMRKVFEQEFRELKIKEKKKQNRLKTAQKEKATQQHQAEMIVPRRSPWDVAEFTEKCQKELEKFDNSLKMKAPVVEKPQSLGVPPVIRTSACEWDSMNLEAHIIKETQSLGVPPVKRTSAHVWTTEEIQALVMELGNNWSLPRKQCQTRQ